MYCLYPIGIDISIFNSCGDAQYSNTLMYENFLSNFLLMVFTVVSTWLTRKKHCCVNILVFTSLCTSKSISVRQMPKEI